MTQTNGLIKPFTEEQLHGFREQAYRQSVLDRSNPSLSQTERNTLSQIALERSTNPGHMTDRELAMSKQAKR